MSTPVGIDLGTTNSVACVFRRGQIETIPVDGSPLLPSVLAVRADGTQLLGQRARSHATLAPSEVIASAKRFIGDGKTTWNLHGKDYTPVDVAAAVLARLKQATEAYLGETVHQAVITVPAYFNNNQRVATRQAGEQAGWEVLQLLPEPEAAAISYALDRGKNQTIVVYDLGGGTFDVSVLTVQGNQFVVQAVGGDAHLGGDDFDRLVGGYLVDALARESGADLSVLHTLVTQSRPPESGVPLAVRQGALRVLEAAEQAKRVLSVQTSAEVELMEVQGLSLDSVLHRETYESLISPLVEQTLTTLAETLASAGKSARDVARVVLVGGSTRNLLVRRRLKEAVKEPWAHERVDEAVAHGAAIVARHLVAAVTPVGLGQSGPKVDNRPEKLVIRSVTPFSLGLRVTKQEDDDHFHVLMPKNSQIPHETYHEFSTTHNKQKSVDIAVFQGEAEHCSDNTFIGGFRLSGIPPAPAGIPRIHVAFRMDNKDLLAVSAHCDDKQIQKTLDVNMVSRFEELGSPAPEMDILFLIDTSGSMETELDGVKRLCLKFADQVTGSGIACQMGLMAFDKDCDGPKYAWELHGPMEPAKLPPAISGLRIGALGGCGCYIGEAETIPVVEAFVAAFPQTDRLRVGILISDEVGNDATATARIEMLLKEGNVCLYVIGVEDSCHQRLAAHTGGRFWDIADRGRVDLSVALNAIAVEITSLALK